MSRRLSASQWWFVHPMLIGLTPEVAVNVGRRLVDWGHGYPTRAGAGKRVGPCAHHGPHLHCTGIP